MQLCSCSKAEMDNFVDVLTGEYFKNPVIIQCGHSFSNDALMMWWATKESRVCPICRQINPNSFNPIPNFALVLPAETQINQRREDYKEEKEHKSSQFYLSMDSMAHVKPHMRFALHSREVHRIRRYVLTMARDFDEKITVFGGTVTEERRISQEFEKRRLEEPTDGSSVPSSLVFSPTTDLDIAFESAMCCDAFIARLKLCMAITCMYKGTYEKIQGLCVNRLKVRFVNNRPLDYLSLDLVYTAEELGVGFAWPDFLEKMIACNLKRDTGSYVINPLIAPVFYRRLLTRGSLMIERPEDRFVRSILRRIDDQLPLQWCLLRPRSFRDLVTNNALLPNDGYPLYFESMLGRLRKALLQGYVVSGISLVFDKESRTFSILHGSHQCGQWKTLKKMQLTYSPSLDAITYVCALTGDETVLFNQFWDI